MTKNKSQEQDDTFITENATLDGNEGKPFITEDSTLTGLFIAKEHKVLPQQNSRQRVQYCVYGDVRKSLEEIYQNLPIGALDVLNGIKSARAMIFTLKGGRG